MFDVLIRGGTVVDGSGKPGLVADVAVDGERIADVGRRDRGLVAKGMAADLADRATFDNGRQTADGVHHVLVNGQFVLRDGARTAALPGRPLR